MQARDFYSDIHAINGKSIALKNTKSLRPFGAFLIFLFICIILVSYHNKNRKDANYTDNIVADFKFDINKISEAVRVAEIKRNSNKSDNINSYGSDGKILILDEIKPDLTIALTKIADSNYDGKVSNEEILSLKIMGLEAGVINKQLSELQSGLDSQDRNLKSYIVITQGSDAGTVLYNGYLKFIDSNNKRYFGIELFK